MEEPFYQQAWFWWVCGAIALVSGLIIFGAVKAVNGLKNARLLLANEQSFPVAAQRIHEYDGFAAARNFIWIGMFQLDAGMDPKIMTGTWRHESRPLFFCVHYVQNKTHIDLVTIFSMTREQGLTTTNSKDGNLFPKDEGSWLQTFPGTDPDRLWDLHNEGEQYLNSRLGIKPEDAKLDFVESVTAGMRKEVNYVCSLFLWPLRVPYWYLVRRNTTHSKTIEQQHKSGMIQFKKDPLRRSF